MENTDYPGPADVAYFTEAQAGAWGDTLRSFARFVDVPSGARVLDVGTGPGLLPRLALESGACLAVGVDDVHAMLRRASGFAAAASGAHFSARVPAWVQGDGLHLPFTSAAFDVVVATNLLFLLADPAAGFAELARAARAGGTVAVVNPAETMCPAAAREFADRRGLAGFARFSFVNFGRLAEGHHRLSAGEWAGLAAAAGLDGVHVEMRAGGLVIFLRGRRTGASA